VAAVAKGDPDREAVLASLHQRLTDLREDALVLAEDETHLHLLPWVRATWIAKGARRQVMTPGTNRRRSTFGAVDLAAGRCFYQVAAKAVSATFTAFCAHLLAAYPTAPVVAVICDNVTIHRSRLVQRCCRPIRACGYCTGPARARTTTRLNGSGRERGPTWPAAQP
jgi:hypothetical protein